LKDPFGSRKQDPDFDFQIGFTPQQTINDSDNFAIAAAQNQTNPSQGSSNALFDNFRDEFPAEQAAGGPDDATISALSGTGLASGDQDEGIGQI
jgi:microcystin degradation protein MlrC